MDTAVSSDIRARLVAHHRDFLGFLEARLRDRALAEDILQDAFVRGFEKADDVRDGESAVAWFYRVLRNAVVDHARRRASENRRLELLALELSDVREDTPTLRQVCKCVSQLADTLKPEYAEALRRIEIEGMSVKDFAAQLGISPSNAGVRVFRAREALRTQLSRCCGTCAEHGCMDCTCGTRASDGAPDH